MTKLLLSTTQPMLVDTATYISSANILIFLSESMLSTVPAFKLVPDTHLHLTNTFLQKSTPKVSYTQELQEGQRTSKLFIIEP